MGWDGRDAMAAARTVVEKPWKHWLGFLSTAVEILWLPHGSLLLSLSLLTLALSHKTVA